MGQGPMVSDVGRVSRWAGYLRHLTRAGAAQVMTRTPPLLPIGA
jgi:hypothetical protein